MTFNIIKELEAEMPQKDEFRSFEVAEILDITRQHVSRMCNEGKFDFFDDDGFQEGAFKRSFSWRIKRRGIIEYLRRINQ